MYKIACLLLALSTSIIFPASEKTKDSKKHVLITEIDSTGYTASSDSAKKRWPELANIEAKMQREIAAISARFDSAEKQRLKLANIKTKSPQKVTALSQVLPVKPLQQIVLDYLNLPDEWEKIQTIPVNSAVLGIGLSQDKKYLVYGIAAKIYELENGEYKYLQNLINDADSFAFSKDNNYLAIGNHHHGNIRLWKLTEGKYKLAQTFPNKGKRIKLAFSDDGHYLVATSASAKIFIWEFDSKNNIYVEKQSILISGEIYGKSIAISPDNKYVATGLTASGYWHGILINKLWTGGRLTTHTTGEEMLSASDVNAVAITKNHLAAGGDDKKISIYDLKNNWFFLTPQVIYRNDLVTSLSFSKDGKFLAVGGNDGAEIFELINGQYMPKQKLDRGKYVAFSADGSYLVSAKDGEVNIWVNTKRAFEHE